LRSRQKVKNRFKGLKVEQNAWEKLIRFEVVHYQFQGNKDIRGNVIKCNKLYCIRVGALNGMSPDFILSLRENSLVAVKDIAGTVQCFFIPPMAMDILFCDGVLNGDIILQYNNNNQSYERPVEPGKLSGRASSLQPFMYIKIIRVFMTGDLAYQAAVHDGQGQILWASLHTVRSDSEDVERAKPYERKLMDLCCTT